MNVLKYLTFFLLMSFLIFPILQIEGQSSGLKITQDQYNWNSDMKNLKITTPEIGLIFKITIWNNGSEPIDFTYMPDYNILWINVRVDSTSTSGVYFFKQLQMNNLYLPPNETLIRFVKVDFAGSQPIGSYTAKLTYSFGQYPSEGQPIVEYPFDYRILDNDTFNREIQQSRNVNVTWLSLTINFSLFTVGDLLTFIGLPSVSIAVFSISILKYKKRKRKTQEDKTSKKSNKPTTKTSPKR
jgi:hypothetical protein